MKREESSVYQHDLEDTDRHDQGGNVTMIQSIWCVGMW